MAVGNWKASHVYWFRTNFSEKYEARCTRLQFNRQNRSWISGGRIIQYYTMLSVGIQDAYTGAIAFKQTIKLCYCITFVSASHTINSTTEYFAQLMYSNL